MPASTLDSSSPRLRAFSTKDTVSGVPGGVGPNTLAFFSAAAVTPCGTMTFADGLVAPFAGPAAVSSSRDPAEPTASSTLAQCCLAQCCLTQCCLTQCC